MGCRQHTPVQEDVPLHASDRFSKETQKMSEICNRQRKKMSDFL